MWRVKPEESGMTLAAFLQGKLGPEHSLRKIKCALEKGAGRVNGAIERFASTRVVVGNTISFQTVSIASSFTLDQGLVLFEDEYFLAYNKPAGLTFEKLDALLGLLPVHRLDKETSGVILFAKNKAVQHLLEELFKKREIQKSYVAIVAGVMSEKSGVIINQLGLKKKIQGQSIYGAVKGGVYAETAWECLKTFKGCSLLLCRPRTGRTHQLRVHLSQMGHPILGDHQYGKTFAQRMMLHAVTLVFIHPITDKPLQITAPLPPEFL